MPSSQQTRKKIYDRKADTIIAVPLYSDIGSEKTTYKRGPCFNVIEVSNRRGNAITDCIFKRAALAKT